MSPIDPRKTVDTPATNPNKGMNTRSFLIAVVVALFVILILIFFVAHHSSNNMKPPKEEKPASRLEVPAPAVSQLATDLGSHPGSAA